MKERGFLPDIVAEDPLNKSTIIINFGLGDIKLETDADDRKDILRLADEVNKAVNSLANRVHDLCSQEDSKKIRVFFGSFMATVASELLIAIEDTPGGDD